MSAFGAKINRALSGESDKNRPRNRESFASTLVEPPSGPTTGRKPLASFGRGGLGNIRPQPSPPLPHSPPDESEPRGRDRTVNPHIQHQKLVSTGRGGAGNFRTASNSPHDDINIIRKQSKSSDGESRSSGRGGLGNITRISGAREPSMTTAKISPPR
ncbi:uncharacterized protein BT62DRAFT_923051 [Guyanagaster necrorhizus]|uniref:Uncharacterized protein n=1 Tax=Guyanagaster necrorhizus TaxID=856835 RepID=A0A9P7VJL9_9AGAR|nr:uncharacterized protein BT62DRAFT_923051 [Guyanagaster necrorhizus MCA 3950]KAG7441827.1 hypothetical protein BT62DRAFT_923051 [Guyanagaster necrorhizus MCA 3950]